MTSSDCSISVLRSERLSRSPPMRWRSLAACVAVVLVRSASMPWRTTNWRRCTNTMIGSSSRPRWTWPVGRRPWSLNTCCLTSPLRRCNCFPSRTPRIHRRRRSRKTSTKLSVRWKITAPCWWARGFRTHRERYWRKRPRLSPRSVWFRWPHSGRIWWITCSMWCSSSILSSLGWLWPALLSAAKCEQWLDQPTRPRPFSIKLDELGLWV